MTMQDRGQHRDAVKDALNERAEELFRQVWGEPQKPGSHDWRVKGQSSRSMAMRGRKRGLWTDHAAGSGGDLLDLIAVEMCGLSKAADNFPQALKEAAAWAGVSTDQPFDLSAIEARKAERDRAAAADDARDAEQKALIVSGLRDNAQQIKGSPSAAYLANRHITQLPSFGLSHMPQTPGLPVLHAGHMALTVWATDAGGKAVGGQRIIIDANGNRPALGEDAAAKPAFGNISGNPARFAARVEDKTLCVCEGPESALSVWQATGLETWAVFGVSSWQSAPLPRGRKIILCPDRDTPVGTYPADSEDAKRKEAAARAFNKALITHSDLDIWIANAPEQEGSKRDLNDTLQRAGNEAVRQAIENAERPPRIIAISEPDSPKAPPRYTVPEGDVTNARRTIDGTLEDLAEAAIQWAATAEERKEAEENGALPAISPAWGLTVTTGAGKSYSARRAAVQLIERLRAADNAQPVVIAVPRHKLADEYIAEMQDVGVKVEVYRGREQQDPWAAPGKHMCRRSDEAKAVQKVGGDVAKALCKSGEDHCPFYHVCGSIRQANTRADIWVMPFNLLFRQPPACIGTPAALIVDEDPTHSQFAGFDAVPTRVSIHDLTAPIKGLSASANADVVGIMGRVARAAEASQDGRIETAAIEASTDDLTAVNKALWETLQTPLVIPATPKADVIKETARVAQHNARVMRTSRLVGIIRTAKDNGAAIVPGVTFEAMKSESGDGYGAIRLRWKNDISDGWAVPTICQSATARHDLLRTLWPHMGEMIEAEAAMPYVSSRQITDMAFGASSWRVPENASPAAKTYANNLIKRLRRYIEHRAALFGGQCLVVAQMGLIDALGPLPANVSTLHYNALSGLDAFKDVRLIIQIGRPMPAPADVEIRAEILLGDGIDRLPGWYEKRPAALTAPDNGTGPQVYTRRGKGKAPVYGTDYHPNEMAEAVRWSICEAELIQGIGRGRGVNRGIDSPLQIDILTNVPLPVPIDEAGPFSEFEPTPQQVMAARGVWPADFSQKGAWNVAAAILPDMGPTANSVRKAWEKAEDRSRGHNPISIYIGIWPRERLYEARARSAGDRYAPRLIVKASTADSAREKLLAMGLDVVGEPSLFTPPRAEPQTAAPPDRPVAPPPDVLPLSRPKPAEPFLMTESWGECCAYPPTPEIAVSATRAPP